jgi:hypothetical protein
MDSENTSAKPIIIRRKKIPVKTFRLLDFHIYDESNKKAVTSTEYGQETSSGSDSDENARAPRSPKRDEGQFIIQMFGLNENGETFCIYINDYQPFFYIKVGEKWTLREAYAYLGEIKKTLGPYYNNTIMEPELIEKQKLYGFSGGKNHKFLKLTFLNSGVMNKVKGLWYEYPEDGGDRKMKKVIYNNTLLELYESNIPPLLRYFHIHNISPSGWV